MDMGRGAGSPSNKVAWAGAYIHTKWHFNPSSHLAITDMRRKFGAVPLWGAGAGPPSNTMWPGPRPTCMPSFTLIHPTFWPQYTNVTDREDRQVRERSDSIGRTVLETVARKLLSPLSYLRLKCTKFDFGFQTPLGSLQRSLRPLSWI